MVIGLQSTGEAAADSLGLQPGDLCGFISTTRQLLLHFVEAHFPTTLALEESQQQGQGQEGEQGELEGGGGGDDASPGRQQQQRQQQGGEEEPTSVQLKVTLLERIAGLDLPPNFLDEVRQPGSTWRQGWQHQSGQLLPPAALPPVQHRHLCLPACHPSPNTLHPCIPPVSLNNAPWPAPTLPHRLWTAWGGPGGWQR